MNPYQAISDSIVSVLDKLPQLFAIAIVIGFIAALLSFMGSK